MDGISIISVVLQVSDERGAEIVSIRDSGRSEPFVNQLSEMV